VGGQDEKAGAQKTFEAGTKLYDAHRYKEALTALRASYQILSSPNSHLMIARCLREMGNSREAYREFQAVAAEAREKGPKYVSAATAATEEGDEVKQRLGFVTVTVKTTGPKEAVKVKLGDETLDASSIGTPVPVDPSTVAVTAEAPDGSSARAEVTVAAGESQTVELTLTPPAADAPPPAPPPQEEPKPVVVSSSGVPLRTWAYVAGGVGVAGLATFAIFGSMSNSKYNDLKDACPTGPCAGHQDEIDAGKTDQLIANIGLGVGIVGLGVGTALFFIGGKSDGDEQHAAAPVRVNLGLRSVAVQGIF
jgi:hypothetical protein